MMDFWLELSGLASLVLLTLTGWALLRRRRAAALSAAAREALPPAPVEAAAPAPAPAPAPAEVDAALQAALQKTQAGLLGRLRQLWSGAQAADEALFEAMEELLLGADVGIAVTTRLLDLCRAVPAAQQTPQVLEGVLRQQLCDILGRVEHGVPAALLAPIGRPRVVIFVGINGVGKTTTLGKVAAHFTQAGRRVSLVAGDTFRAAAPEQLQLWAERSGAQLQRGSANADPASVVYAAVAAAKQEQQDLVLADTAGRLHTNAQLMDEIKKVCRAAGKACDGAPDEVWLVVDATTGQNALLQAREFHQALGLTGLILTKLDGSAKGGVVVALVEALGLPIRYVGLGEGAADLRPFDPTAFVAGLFAPAATPPT